MSHPSKAVFRQRSRRHLSFPSKAGGFAQRSRCHLSSRAKQEVSRSEAVATCHPERSRRFRAAKPVPPVIPSEAGGFAQRSRCHLSSRAKQEVSRSESRCHLSSRAKQEVSRSESSCAVEGPCVRLDPRPTFLAHSNPVPL